MNLYNLRMLAPNRYAMAKFDSDFNVSAVYNLEPKGHSWTCDCPANARSVVLRPCKHKRMIPLMLGACNTDRFFDPESGAWCQPLGDLERPEAGRYEASPEKLQSTTNGTLLAEDEPPIASEASSRQVIEATIEVEPPICRAEPILAKPAPTIRRR